MTRDEAIRAACAIMTLAYRSIGQYDRASDGFCSACPAETRHTFENAGLALLYVEHAVRDKLARDGFEVPADFGAECGLPSSLVGVPPIPYPRDYAREFYDALTALATERVADECTQLAEEVADAWQRMPQSAQIRFARDHVEPTP